MKKICLMAAMAAAAVQGAGPVISGFTYDQPQGSRSVLIDYTVNERAIVTVDVLTNGVSVGAENLTGFREDGYAPTRGSALNRVVDSGEHHVTWRPDKVLPNLDFHNGEVSIRLRAYSLKMPPIYMLADLSATNSVHYYNSTNELPYGCLVTNNPYRSEKMLLRFIPAAHNKFYLGTWDTNEMTYATDSGYRNHETARFCTLTENFYIGVFELTQSQYAMIKGSNPSVYQDPDVYPEHDYHPCENFAFEDVRGTKNFGCDCTAPTKGSVLAKMRSLTGVDFDLPWEAQWVYACRGRLSTSYNNGTSDTNGLCQVAWYNGHVVVTRNRTFPGGLLAPNEFGLYDMHGNVFEMTKDAYYHTTTVPSTPVTDPTGETAGSLIVIKGGSCSYAAAAASAGAIRYYGYGSREDRVGCRLTAPLPQ